MDTNGDLGIMSHVGYLRRTPELSQENGFRKVFLAIVKFHKISNVTPVTCLVKRMDYGLCNIPVKTDPQ